MKTFSLPFSSVAVLLASGSSAWILDSSCINSSPRNYQSLVTNGVAGAFVKAQAGQDALNSLKGGSASSELQDLQNYLFHETTVGGANDPFLAKAIGTFAAILGFQKGGGPEPKPQGALPVDDVIIYCDYSRFDENKDCNGADKNGVACDKDTSLEVVMDSTYTGCKTSVNFDTTEAWTVSNSADNKIAQVQLCTWFLQFSYGSKRKYWKDTGPKAILARPAAVVQKLFGSRTAMDGAALFDHTILHEFSHAIKPAANNVGSTQDVGGDDGAYGWKNCLRLSPWPSGGTGGSTSNADSYAYFGLGAEMIAGGEGVAPQIPQEDGTIGVPASGSSGSRKREASALSDLSSLKTTSTVTNSATFTIGSSSVVLDASETSQLVLTEKTKTITIKSSSAYTVGTDVISLASNAVVLDSTMYDFTRDTTLKTSTKTTAATTSAPLCYAFQDPDQGNSGGCQCSGVSTLVPFMTSTAGEKNFQVCGYTTIPKATATNTGVSAKTTTTTGKTSAATTTGKSSAKTSLGETTGKTTLGETTGKTTASGETSSKKTTSAGSSAKTTSRGSTAKTTSGESTGKTTSAKTTSDGSSGKSTASGGSTGVTSSSGTKTYASETVSSGSSTTVVPITVITATNTGKTTQITYTSTHTSSGAVGPTGVWECTGPLCDVGGGCIIPLFCKSKPASGASWGICCGWDPIPPAGGVLPPGGPPSPPDSTDPSDPTNKPTTAPTTGKTTAKSTQGTTGSEKSTGKSTESSCTTTKTASSCAITLSVFTPSGSSSAKTSTITGTCSTTKGCSVTDTTRTTTTTSSGEPGPTVTAIPHYYPWDNGDDWDSQQQSALDALASTNAAYETFSAGATTTNSTQSSTSTAKKTGSSGTATKTGTTTGKSGSSTGGSKTSAATTSTPLCYPFSDPDAGAQSGCQCSGLTSIIPTMKSTSGMKSYNICGYTALPTGTGASFAPAPPFTTTESNGAVVSCATSTYFNKAVLNQASCAGATKVVSTVSSIASAFSASSRSSASKASVAAASSSASASSAAAATQTPTADCTIYDAGLYYQFQVYNINGWGGVNLTDLKKQEGGCGAMTGWHAYPDCNPGNPDLGMAYFNLPFLIKSGCVERAIHSAGGPDGIHCQGGGSSLDEGDSWHDCSSDSLQLDEAVNEGTEDEKLVATSSAAPTQPPGATSITTTHSLAVITPTSSA